MIMEKDCDFCEENNMVIGGTLFQHKDIHKMTWTSPNGAIKSQIEHIQIQDIRARRGADAASYHDLLVGAVSRKLREAQRARTRGQKIDPRKLREYNTRQAPRRELKNRFQSLGKE